MPSRSVWSGENRQARVGSARNSKLWGRPTRVAATHDAAAQGIQAKRVPAKGVLAQSRWWRGVMEMTESTLGKRAWPLAAIGTLMALGCSRDHIEAINLANRADQSVKVN